MSVMLRERSLCLSTDVLNLILMPTEACNFRCTYCYEDFRQGRMRADVVEGVKNLIQQRIPHIKRLEMTWFGGEPLLAFDIVEDVMSRIAELRELYPNVSLTGHMTTNAYTLDKARFGRLLALGISRYQVSFDGPKEVHDKVRRRANGSGSFDRVWANLIAMRELPDEFKVLVRLHVDRDNLQSVPRFIRSYARVFGKDGRFKLYVRRRSKFGGMNDRQMRTFKRKEADRIVASLNNLLARRGLAHVEGRDFMPLCYAARGNSLVVRADGRLNKCTIALEHPNNQVGQINVQGQIDLHPERMLMWMRGVWSGQEEHLRCPMRGYADLSSTMSAGDVRTSRPQTSDALQVTPTG